MAIAQKDLAAQDVELARLALEVGGRVVRRRGAGRGRGEDGGGLGKAAELQRGLADDEGEVALRLAAQIEKRAEALSADALDRAMASNASNIAANTASRRTA